MTQAEVAEAAGVSDRTYADIERGTANMRTATLQHICLALKITPDVILTEDETELSIQQSEILAQLEKCGAGERETALRLLKVYLDSLSK